MSCDTHADGFTSLVLHPLTDDIQIAEFISFVCTQSETFKSLRQSRAAGHDWQLQYSPMQRLQLEHIKRVEDVWLPANISAYCPKCIHYKHLSKRKCCLKWSLVSLSASLFEQFKGSYLRLSFHLNESPDTKYKSGLRFGWYSYLSPLWRMFKVTLLSPPKSPLLLSISHSKSPSYLTLSFPPASSHHST